MRIAVSQFGRFVRHWCAAVFFTLVLARFFALTQTASAASAKELLASGHADEAIQALGQRTARFNQDAEAYNQLCRAYFMLDDWDRSIPACERARNLDSQNSLYSLWLGRAYGEKADRTNFFAAAGMAKKVRVAFERAVELDPKNADALTDLAEFYVEAPGMMGGGKEKAHAAADKLMALNPAMSHWIAARIAEKSKDAAEAEREYRAAIAVSHGAAREWVDFAIFLWHANRMDEMEQALDNIESAPVDRAESVMDGASILLRTGRDPALAVHLLHRYLTHPVEEGPAFKAHTMLGELLERQGDRSGAAEEFRAALALAHSYTRAQDDLKRLEH
jgi:tetratricopeptide (TPR) repeat protein